jgi:hypothetical protein
VKKGKHVGKSLVREERRRDDDGGGLVEIDTSTDEGGETTENVFDGRISRR